MFETAFGQKPDGVYQSLILSSIGRINLGCFSRTGSAIGEHVRIISRQKMGNVQNTLLGFLKANIFQILTAIEKKRDKNVQLPEKQICETKFNTNTRNPQTENVVEETHQLDLPEHVIFQILAKLPAEDAWNVRRVCKKWQQIVTCSYFISQHIVTG